MKAIVIGGTLDGQTIDVNGSVLYNAVQTSFWPEPRWVTETYHWDIIGTERILMLGETKTGVM